MADEHRKNGFVKIILVSPVDAEAIETLRSHHEVAIALDYFTSDDAEFLRDQEVLVFRSGGEITRDMLDRSPKLSLVVRAGSGFDNIDLDDARRRGIRVVRIPGPSARSVAEFTFGLMLSLCRKIVQADALVRDGRWPKPQLGGALLSGKVLGIVGAGNIGSRVGELGVAWDMKVLGCVNPADERWEPPPGIEPSDMGTVLRRADFLTLHTPLTEANYHLIGADELAAMKDGSYIVNTARGGVVDEAALYEALASGHLAGAALDVHEQEGEGVIPKLAELPNVVLTPHIGGSAHESQRAIGRRLVELIDAHSRADLNAEVTDSELLV